MYDTFCRETLKYNTFCRETLKYNSFLSQNVEIRHFLSRNVKIRHFFVAKRWNTTLFVAKCWNTAIFCRVTLKYALRAKKWQICVASWLHILCYSGTFHYSAVVPSFDNVDNECGIINIKYTIWNNKYAIQKMHNSNNCCFGAGKFCPISTFQHFVSKSCKYSKYLEIQWWK